jgi:capsule polysaccharide export protein KpsE/RkpR
MFRRLLQLTEENIELKSQLKIQSIESEAREQIHHLEAEIGSLREQLHRSETALKQATHAKESLEKRITELDHRSRLLEERAKSLTEKQPEGDHIDQLNAVLHEMPVMVERLLDKALQAAHSEQQRKPAKSRNKRQKDAEANTSQKPESR